ncbi:MAG: PqqD family protein [Clostridiales bacterium]|nr:PqqD family protein [Clostridiales bacterium]
MSRDFMLREIAGESLLVPVNEAAVNFQGIMSLNESGRLLWDRLQKDTTEDDLVSALLDVYDTTPEVARQDVAVFLDQLRERDILQEA